MVPYIMSRTQNSRIMQEVTVMKVEKYFQLTYILSIVTNTSH